MRCHAHFIKICLQEKIIPRRLTIEKKAAVGENDEDFNWGVDVRNQLTKNTMVISEAYDSLRTIENWSKEDKKELETKYTIASRRKKSC